VEKDPGAGRQAWKHTCGDVGDEVDGGVLERHPVDAEDPARNGQRGGRRASDGSTIETRNLRRVRPCCSRSLLRDQRDRTSDGLPRGGPWGLLELDLV
jgi:hypothetical protein